MSLLCINEHPYTHGNTARFINSCVCSLFSASCLVKKLYNDKEFFMKMKASIFIFMYEVHSMSTCDELL